jgi:ABC-type transport system involved in multi-copper enzyme maturation permease subunit
MKAQKINQIFGMMLFNSRINLISIGLALVFFEILIHWFLLSSMLGDIPQQFFKLVPPQFKAFLGDEGLGFLTPLSMVTIGYTHPFIYVLFTAFPAVVVHREISSSIFTGIMEFSLARPVSRTVYLLTVFIFMVFGLIILGLCLIVSTYISLLLFGISSDLTPFLLIVINLVCLFFLLGNLFLMVGVWLKSNTKVTGYIIGIALGVYLFEYLGRSIKLIGYTSVINPFHYYRPQTILSESIFPTGDLVLLIAVGLVFFALALYKFKLRDI